MNSALPLIRILVVHDQQLIRAGLRLLLESEPDFYVMAEAVDGAEFIFLTRLKWRDKSLVSYCAQPDS